VKLILLRHAKSGWDDPGLDDHDRPLAPRGRRAAPVMGAWLRGRGHRPDRVLCSSARRTRETLELLALDPCEVRVLPELYLAEAGTLLRLVEREGAGAGTLMVVGHNPGIGRAAAMCVRDPPSDPAFGRFPTAACLVAGLDGPPPGEALDFAVPRDLVATSG
jgi:phosphohistidine phosphatase